MKETKQGREGLFRFSMVQFLVALILLIVAYPFFAEVKHGEIVEHVLMMMLLISAVLAVGSRSLVLTILLVLPALAGPWINEYLATTVPYWIFTAAHMCFVGFVVSQLLRFILRARRVNSEVMCAAISGYLMLGIFWTAAYRMVSQYNRVSFVGAHLAASQGLGAFDGLYLSFVTLTGLGCGDIAPATNIARMLLMVESMAGVLYLTVLVARLVSLYSRESEKRQDDQSQA
jgi:hypothetical protein